MTKFEALYFHQILHFYAHIQYQPINQIGIPRERELQLIGKYEASCLNKIAITNSGANRQLHSALNI